MKIKLHLNKMSDYNDYLNDEYKYDDIIDVDDINLNDIAHANDDIYETFIKTESKNAIRTEDIHRILELQNSYILEYAVLYNKLHLIDLMSLGYDMMNHAIQAGNNHAVAYMLHKGYVQDCINLSLEHNSTTSMILALNMYPGEIYNALYASYKYNNITIFRMIVLRFLVPETSNYNSSYICDLMTDALSHNNIDVVNTLYYLASVKRDMKCARILLHGRV